MKYILLIGALAIVTTLFFIGARKNDTTLDLPETPEEVQNKTTSQKTSAENNPDKVTPNTSANQNPSGTTPPANNSADLELQLQLKKLQEDLNSLEADFGTN